MKALDRALQRWRIARAAPYIPHGARVLDVGCHRGELLERLRSRIAAGVGVDPALEAPLERAGMRLVPGSFPGDVELEPGFDAITMLAVLEHIPRRRLAAVPRACEELLNPGGVVIVTVPSPWVDRILAVLLGLRLIDGMSLEEHWGFDPSDVLPLFGERFETVAARRFQLGLNYLFVLRKPLPPQAPAGR